MKRLIDERAYHDRQAAERARTFAAQPHRLRLKDSEYLDHAPWIRPALAELGDLTGQQVLDYGSGHGMASVIMARRGAMVTACDLSPGYCAEAQRRAAANECPINIVACNGEELPFVNSSFDAIWGHAILHHLDVATAAAELRRVLKPGGRVVLCEPWGGTPIWRWIRRWRSHTEAERPLNRHDIQLLSETFKLTIKWFQLGRYVVIRMT